MERLRDRFAALVAAGTDCDLARAALEIARIGHPDLEPEDYLRHLDALAAAVRPRLSSTMAPEDAASVLTTFLYEECGFRGNEENYYDPRNSYLNEVLERRAGIPITLAVVLIEVAARVGLVIEGVGFPGHFLVRVPTPRGPLLLDPFSGGSRVSDQELRERLRGLHGGRTPDVVPPEALETADRPAILARMLRNLLRIFTERDEHDHALLAVDLLLVLTPDAAADVRTRGLLYERLECFGAAADDFRRYLELAPEAPDADEVRGRLVRLTQEGPTVH
jgi:regulator of sirC expression with transglutaminase-like and TPR domain